MFMRLTSPAVQHYVALEIAAVRGDITDLTVVMGTLREAKNKFGLGTGKK